MKCLKTGFRFSMGGLTYAADLYEAQGRLTLIANRHGYDDPDAVLEGAIESSGDEIAPGVGYALVKMSDEFLAFHRRWNFEVPVELLSEPVLVVMR